MKPVLLAAGIAAVLVAPAAVAQKLYRCGSTFSQTPCGSDAAEIHTPKFNAAGSAADTAGTGKACAASLRAKGAFADPEAVRVDNVTAGTAKVIEYNYVQIIAREYGLTVSVKNKDGEYGDTRSFTCVTSEDGQRVLEVR